MLRAALVAAAILLATAGVAVYRRFDGHRRVRGAAGEYVMALPGSPYSRSVEYVFDLRPDGRWARVTRVFPGSIPVSAGDTVRVIDADSGRFAVSGDLVTMRTDGAEQRLHLYVLHGDTLEWSGRGNPVLGNTLPDQLVFVRRR